MTGHYRICCDDELIGVSDLESLDPGMGTATGKFTPAPGYERVRNVFRLFAEAHRDTGPPDPEKLASYYQARDLLALTVETSSGEVVSVDLVHIADFRDSIDESACEVEIHVSDASFFDDPR